MKDAHLTDGDLLSNEMEINLHMFGALKLNVFGGEVDDAHVVAVDKGVPRR
jgi:hypothetical protein